MSRRFSLCPFVRLDERGRKGVQEERTGQRIPRARESEQGRGVRAPRFRSNADERVLINSRSYLPLLSSWYLRVSAAFALSPPCQGKKSNFLRDSAGRRHCPSFCRRIASSRFDVSIPTPESLCNDDFLDPGTFGTENRQQEFHGRFAHLVNFFFLRVSGRDLEKVELIHKWR